MVGSTTQLTLLSPTVGISAAILTILVTSSIYINELKRLWLRVFSSTNTKQGKGDHGDGKDKYSDDSESDSDSDLKAPEPEPKPQPTSSPPATATGSSPPRPADSPLLKRAVDRLRRRGPRASAPDAERDVGILAVAPEFNTLGDGTEDEKAPAREAGISEIRLGSKRRPRLGIRLQVVNKPRRVDGRNWNVRELGAH